MVWVQAFVRLLLLLSLLLSAAKVSCLAQTTAHTFIRYEDTHPQMGTLFRIVCYAPDSAVARRAVEAAWVRVDTLNARYSDYLPDSELNRLCATAGSGQWVPVSDDLADILRLSGRFWQESGGAFDASVGPLTRLWRRARQLKELPDTARLEAALQRVGWQYVEMRSCSEPRWWQVWRRGRGREATFQRSEKTCQVRLSRAGMQLDLGGIAQGYAADACLQVLRTYGIKQALADAGGDIALGAPPPDAAGWAIKVPMELGDSLIWLSHCGITTSGATFRYVEHEGVRYSHIVDPRTGWGLTHGYLVTVMAPNATTADAWATAISVSGVLPQKQHPRKRVSAWVRKKLI
jgi:FAD:protein FMN transferase